jgi:two-component system LytT family response regulator
MELLSAYLVDDEYLALRRLTRLLSATNRVKIIGGTTDPTVALKFLSSTTVDVLFLDIHMPGMTAFELLASLSIQPLVVFTTAYDQYALKAFEVSSIDYLLKPVDPRHLDRALNKLESLRGSGYLEVHNRLQSVLTKLTETLSPDAPGFPDRICSRLGERIRLIDLNRITHFFSEDKLTYACVDNKQYVVNYTLAELERALRAREFIRIHRATLINLSLVDEIHRWFGGRMIVRMKDKSHTELTVARNYLGPLKEKLKLR